MKNLLTRRLGFLGITILSGIISLPVLASNVEITRHETIGDRVKLRVKVTDDNQVPIEGLKENTFQLETTDAKGNKVTLDPEDLRLIPSSETKPDPARLILLLDMSGSMKNKDDSDNVKLQAAVDGIQEFLEDIEESGFDVELAIVPYGITGNSNCQHGYQVNEENIEKAFEIFNSDFGNNYEKLKKQLDIYAAVDVCAGTDIYQPVTESVKYLSTKYTSKKEDDNKLPPRLAVILLTDGYHSKREKEREEFTNLTQTIENNPEVKVHTMGYGKDLETLKKNEAVLKGTNRPCNVDTNPDKLTRYCELRGGEDIAPHIIDKPVLEEIAKRSSALSRFPGNPREVVDTLRLILTSLREYEVVYNQPGADRGTIHETKVAVNFPESINNVPEKLESNVEQIRFKPFMYKILEAKTRWTILLVALISGGGGFFYYKNWISELKDEAQKYLT